MAIETGWILAKAITGEIALAQYLEVPSNDENTVAIEVPNDNIFQAVLKDPSKYYYSFEFSCILSKTQEQIDTEKTIEATNNKKKKLKYAILERIAIDIAGLDEERDAVDSKIAKLANELGKKLKKCDFISTL